ncbi:MAG: hypothetical protein JRH20_31080 [Deltaproteobacteria bacterium]|nr:hypothetical protein [Deltaproteobacteria bacterium]
MTLSRGRAVVVFPTRHMHPGSFEDQRIPHLHPIPPSPSDLHRAPTLEHSGLPIDLHQVAIGCAETKNGQRADALAIAEKHRSRSCTRTHDMPLDACELVQLDVRTPVDQKVDGNGE